MNCAIQQWLHEINELDHGALDGEKWRAVRSTCSGETWERLYCLIARHLKVTHIAINRPIPLTDVDQRAENVLRAPLNFTPVYGEFGPSTCNSPPLQHDFDAAFWTVAKQNGIFQTWAPQWTMFSRGNISEKARLLTLPSVQTAVEEGKTSGKGCVAVDLFAGIGYFAFSYLKAGVDQVLCWDLNPWSIEGLIRGTLANKWSYAIPQEDLADQGEVDSARVIIFSGTNEHAPKRVQSMSSRLPPIRHVNCGLLPNSDESLPIAVEVLDQALGGWIHVHGNCASSATQEKALHVQAIIQAVLNKTQTGKVAEVESINPVKSYAPGVMHCVVDIYIPPLPML